MLFSVIKPIFQSAGFLISIFANALVIFLVITESPQKLGNYRFLVCYLSVISTIYAFLDFVVAPYTYSHENSALAIMHLEDTVFESIPYFAFLLIVSMCGCFGVNITAIAINFIYRFFALEREGRLRYFDGKRLLIWITLSLINGFITSMLYLTIGPRDEISDYVRENLKLDYQVDIDKSTYVGWLYWKLEFGSKVLNMRDLEVYLGLNALMMVPFCIIILYGFKSYLKIKDLISHGESEYSKRLQLQLYKALVSQTLIPVIFLFAPTGFLLTCPLFGIDIKWSNEPITIIYSIYLAVDSMPIIFLVDEYRNAFLNFFRKILSKPQVATVHYSTSVEMF
ncbi:Serpentine receptor class r-10 [Caenorhabditis elegans]|uniref:Serpentine receptor class r-10 n=1 Tax=Caenorhabditis elegans TaxID=6239 RepID=O44528_CAEEL|nr:Seven TM Receptor [Caenorhabditis elegans]CCD73992.1 Seven TM Receptor [Caenorhabditis elegans]|eukprot:NP_500668.1 Seven TM Receptor [Caenorhabditis elegans]